MPLYSDHSDQQIKEFAIDLYNKKIFCDRHVPQGQEEMLKHIFMPLIFIKPEPDSFDDFGMIFEYFDKAGPMGVNGFPVFPSCYFLNKTQADKLWKEYEAYSKMITEYMTGGCI